MSCYIDSIYIICFYLLILLQNTHSLLSNLIYAQPRFKYINEISKISVLQQYTTINYKLFNITRNRKK